MIKMTALEEVVSLEKGHANAHEGVATRNLRACSQEGRRVHRARKRARDLATTARDVQSIRYTARSCHTFSGDRIECDQVGSSGICGIWYRLRPYPMQLDHVILP